MNAPAPKASITALPETLFAVPGMRCAGCISKIETGLTQVPGIAAARVNFTAKRVAISHLPEICTSSRDGTVEHIFTVAQNKKQRSP